MAEPNKEAPGEVRSNLQIVVRIVLAVVVIALLIGLGFALVRLLSRPDALQDAATAAPHIAHLFGASVGTLS